jgi:uncharacterized membrane protein YciS (DUF1049 family)
MNFLLTRKGAMMFDIILGISSVIISGILFIKTKRQEDKDQQLKESDKALHEATKKDNADCR